MLELEVEHNPEKGLKRMIHAKKRAKYKRRIKWGKKKASPYWLPINIWRRETCDGRYELHYYSSKHILSKTQYDKRMNSALEDTLKAVFRGDLQNGVI